MFIENSSAHKAFTSTLYVVALFSFKLFAVQICDLSGIGTSSCTVSGVCSVCSSPCSVLSSAISSLVFSCSVCEVVPSNTAEYSLIIVSGFSISNPNIFFAKSFRLNVFSLLFGRPSASISSYISF